MKRGLKDPGGQFSGRISNKYQIFKIDQKPVDGRIARVQKNKIVVG